METGGKVRVALFGTHRRALDAKRRPLVQLKTMALLPGQDRDVPLGRVSLGDVAWDIPQPGREELCPLAKFHASKINEPTAAAKLWVVRGCSWRRQQIQRPTPEIESLEEAEACGRGDEFGGDVLGVSFLRESVLELVLAEAIRTSAEQARSGREEDECADDSEAEEELLAEPVR